MANPNIVNVTDIKGGNYGWALSNTFTATLLTVASDVILKINRRDKEKTKIVINMIKNVRKVMLKSFSTLNL